MARINIISRPQSSPQNHPHTKGTYQPRAEEPLLNKKHPDIITAPKEVEITGSKAYLAYVKISDISGKISSN